jgi:putative holliday junction resolvase
VPAAIGLDLGERRIGVALSRGRLALPIDVIRRSGDRQRDHRNIRAVIVEHEAEVLVVGLPRSLDGGDGPAAMRIRDEARELEAVVGVPVVLVDERLSTVEAQRSLRAQGITGPRQRALVDQVAASIILQAWLDRDAMETNEP